MRLGEFCTLRFIGANGQKSYVQTRSSQYSTWSRHAVACIQLDLDMKQSVFKLGLYVKQSVFPLDLEMHWSVSHLVQTCSSQYSNLLQTTAIVLGLDMQQSVSHLVQTRIRQYPTWVDMHGSGFQLVQTCSSRYLNLVQTCSFQYSTWSKHAVVTISLCLGTH